MARPGVRRARAVAVWAALALAIGAPLAAAATSPFLQWRDPVYILAGFAGIVGLGLLLVQPLLAAGYLPGLAGLGGRRAHRRIGAGLVAAVVIHVGALWITSPPDVVDVLLFRSPTPFSVWGVVAMWTVFALAAVAARRRRLRRRTWHLVHMGLATVIVVGTVVHALLIQGTMETVTKAMLCALVVAAAATAVARVVLRSRRRTQR